MIRLRWFLSICVVLAAMLFPIAAGAYVAYSSGYGAASGVILHCLLPTG